MLALSTNQLYLTQGLKAAKAANSNETDSVERLGAMHQRSSDKGIAGLP